MLVGERLREERLRLGLSQPAFAALAGATKSALVKWERDNASPNLRSLTAWSEAGADALYILTGRRSPDLPDNPVAQIEQDLASIRRKLLEPARELRRGEDQETADLRELEGPANQLTAMLRYDRSFLTAAQRDEIEQLLDATNNTAALALYRAADHAQQRNRRREMKDRLYSWLTGGPYVPGDAVANLLAALALDYAVPIKFVVELVQELHEEIAARLAPSDLLPKR